MDEILNALQELEEKENLKFKEANEINVYIAPLPNKLRHR